MKQSDISQKTMSEKDYIMEKKITDELIEEFKAINENSADAETVKKLFKAKDKHSTEEDIVKKPSKKKNEYAFTDQYAYDDLESLEFNIRNSVLGYSGNKDTAIGVYERFVDFLREKGIPAEVHFPPIPVSNIFERLLYIVKVLHYPDKSIYDLPDELWVGSRTIEDDLSKLRGPDDNTIQICGKVFKIQETERSKGKITSASTAHPLFLTLNLTQVIIMLKGLKAMSENGRYAKYAETAATDIWEQLSDYAKTRIHFVLSKLMSEDLSWYESLEITDNHFLTEYECSVNNDVIVSQIYTNCRYVSESDDFAIITFMSDQGEKTIKSEDILRSAYTPEELL